MGLYKNELKIDDLSFDYFFQKRNNTERLIFFR